MTPTVFQAIRRPEVFVGRSRLLTRIRQALDEHRKHPNRTLVITVRGRGGYGKTRLLEEILLRLGRKDILPRLGLSPDFSSVAGAWCRGPDAEIQYAPSTLLDFALPELSARPNLLRALRQSLVGPRGVSFDEMDYLFARERGLRTGFAEFRAWRALQRRFEAAFQQDLRSNIRQGILPVWAWDTVERLAIPFNSPLWQELGEAAGKPLLTWEEADFISGPWFVERLRRGLFTGAVFLLAGREEEGQAFWQALETAVQEAPPSRIHLVSLPIEAFQQEEVKAFVEAVAKFLQARQAEAPWLAERLPMLKMLTDEAYLPTLTLLTAGQPVLLSIFLDVLVTTPEPPISFADIRAQLENIKRNDKLLQEYRDKITGEFISLLLQRGLKEDSLQGQILLALARSPRGLEASQLHALLPDASLEQIQRDMQALLNLTIVKYRPLPPPPQKTDSLDGPMSAGPSTRLALQDEVYRIFADYITQQASPQARKKEEDQRRAQYQTLRDRAKERLDALRKQRQALFRAQLQSLDLESARRVLQPRWDLRASDEARMAHLNQSIRFWELEYLHYEMLLDPPRAWNSRYLDLAETRWYTNSLEGDIVLQSEIRTLLEQHKWLLRFTSVPEKAENSPRDLRRLRFAVRTEEVVRWVKRLILAEEPERAVHLSQAIEDAIARLEPERQDKEGWMHPLSWGERRVWETYARILAGERPQLQDLEIILDYLKDLLHRPWSETEAIPQKLRRIKPGGKNLLAHPFRGLKGDPASERARRVLAIGYNFLGYGYVVQGEFQTGLQFYQESLRHMQHIDFPAQEAATRNNLGRALAEVGRVEAGLHLVYQALRLRESLSGWIPYAYSLNTAALINNENSRPIRALGQAARAAAIFARFQEWRGRGMALIEVATALRRLAKTSDPGLLNTVVGEPEDLLAVATEAIEEALTIFAPRHCHTKDTPRRTTDESGESVSDHTAAHPQRKDTPREETTEEIGVCEPVRRLDALLQKGEIWQDGMAFANSPTQLQRLYAEAQDIFAQARQICRKHGWRFLEAKTLVDMVETHYWYAYYLRRLTRATAEERWRAERERAILAGLEILAELQAPDKFFDTDMVIKERGTGEERQFQPPRYEPRYAPAWKLLSKRHRFEAGLLFERLLLQHLNEGWHNAVNRDERSEIARNFVKAALYGRLFGPRSRIIRQVYRFLSRYLDEFQAYLAQWRDRSGAKHGEDDSDSRSLRKFIDDFYHEIEQWWEWYHKKDPWYREIISIQSAQPTQSAKGSILPDPKELASLPRWLREVYLLPLHQ